MQIDRVEDLSLSFISPFETYEVMYVRRMKGRDYVVIDLGMLCKKYNI